MSKLIILAFLFLLVVGHLSLVTPSLARTTPEDILDSQRQVYNQRLSHYSSANQQKLKQASQSIANFNAQKTTFLEDNMIRQGEILDEYMRRNNMQEAPETDGIHRNLSKPVENARYWLTYAHEAVAYQAAHVYILNLSSEGNIKSDINSGINAMQSDLNVLSDKVAKSQKLIADLVK